MISRRLVELSTLLSLVACSGSADVPAEGGRMPDEASTDDGGATQDGAAESAHGDASPESGPLSGLMFLGGTNMQGPVGGVSLDDGWTWDGSGWTDLGFVLPGGLDSFAVASPHGSPVVFGGVRRSGVEQAAVLGDTLTWDGTRFETQTPLDAPSARCGAAAATLGDRVVLFGGDLQDIGSGTPAYLGDTWTWDGATWAQANPTSSPSPRAFAAAATQGGNVVLYGGVGNTDAGSVDLHDTWVWNGATWSPASASGYQPALGQPLMASLGNSVVLFGYSMPYQQGPQTWIWDGCAWTQKDGMGPAWAGAMGSLDGQAVLFGGTGDAEFFFEDAAGLWTFDGNQWAALAGPAPTPRLNAGMAVVGSPADF